jgi:hypothetical protein
MGWAMAAPPQRHDHIFVVPAPKKVVLDGDLREWDLSGAIETAFDDLLRPRFTVTVALMYDDHALYIGAHFFDDTPLLNRHDPAVEPNRGWDGDCLQVRLCSDPNAPYPLPFDFARQSDRVCHLTMWLFTDKDLPALHIHYGWYNLGEKIWTGKEALLAFRKDKDGKGYTLEACIPWERLNAKKGPPKANDRIALVFQPLWSDSTGWRQVCTFNEVIREVGFSFQNPSMWGQAIFLPKGHLKPARRPKAPAEEALPLTLRLPLPDPKAKIVSAAIFNGQGELVRSLPVIQRTEEDIQRGGKFATIQWDGLDDEGRPLPAGRYMVKLLTHRGIGQRYVTSLHNAGNPPWRTDDGTGSWGGDHGLPIAAASDNERVYLCWMVAEAGWHFIAVDPKLPEGDGVITRIGKKFWGQHAALLETGQLPTALASDGERLFVAQDGKKGSRGWNDPKVPNIAVVVLFEAKTGKPINFPFGKRELILSEYSDSLKPPEVQNIDPHQYFYIPRKRFWERLIDYDFGPQELGWNLLGIAVSGDVLYGSLFLEDKIVAFNWRTGERLREFSVPKPCGLAVTKEGQLVAVSGKRLVRLNPQTGELRVLAEGLSAPWGVALDEAGNIYVTDCGKAMQVKVFDSDGKFLRAIGKEGGRPWVGRYDPNGLLRPSGITVDREGKVWVCEHEDAPKRISVWTKEGKLVAELFGAGHYATEGTADEQNPQYVITHATLFSVDYATGKWQVLATLFRPYMQRLSLSLHHGYPTRPLQFRHVRGRTYIVSPHGGPIWLLGDDFVMRPVAYTGMIGGLPYCGLLIDELPIPEDIKQEYRRNMHAPYVFRWSDLNGDSMIQPEEFVVEKWVSGSSLHYGVWVDDDLTIWGAKPFGIGAIYRIPVKEWLPNGVPIYPTLNEVKPLMFVKGKSSILHLMVDGDKLFVFEQEGGDAYGKGAKWMAISCYQIPSSPPPEPTVGKRLWAYRRTWLGFGLEAPLSKPGDVVGAQRFIGKAKLDNGITIIGVNGYFGQFNLLTDSGLWVASLCKDGRYGPKADETTIWCENFSGFLFRNRQDGKVYLIAGETDCRIWEVTGLESLRTATVTVTLTEKDQKLAMKALSRRFAVAAPLPPIHLPKVVQGRLTVDGDLSDWEMKKAVTIEGGANRRAKVVLAYDEANLYVAFEVQDDSPMKNSGKDFALLFKTGDACDLFLGADPSADPKRTKSVAGDLRLLFSVMDDRPVCVLYEPVLRSGEKRSPRVFTSPTGVEVFDRVEVLEVAKVAVKRRADGYTLEAAVPLSAISFAPKAGTSYKGDVGVIWSDAGGSRNVFRACYFNKETAIVNDIPTEARLQVGNWGLIVAE